MKKFVNASNIVAALSCVLALVTLILYVININVNGYYQGVTAPGVILFCILVMVFDLVIVGANFLKLEGILGKVVDIVVMALKVLVPCFLMIVAMILIQTRISGLGYIFFSNVDVIKEVQTPANLASAYVAIATIAFTVLGSLVGVVGAFFLPKKD